MPKAMQDFQSVFIQLFIFVFLKELIQEQGCFPLSFCLGSSLLPPIPRPLQKAHSPVFVGSLPVLLIFVGLELPLQT